MKKSAFISDILFTFFVCGLFTLCLFRYLGVSLPFAFFLSCLCGGLLAAAVWAFLQSKRKTFFLKKSDEAQKQKLLLHLALLSDEQKIKFFINLISNEQPARRFSRSYIATPTQFYCIKCTFGAVTANEIAAFYRLKTAKQRILLCSQIEESAYTLCKKLQIKVQTADDIYQLVKKNNAFPATFLGETPKEKKHSKQFKLCFAKANSKRFLISGSLLLLSSFLTPFPFYYLIIGSILLLTATFIRIFGYE